jgi:hypothetical protein
MWEDNTYCWVGSCKNWWFHHRRNPFFGHKIILAETDAIEPLPPLDLQFSVCCEECGKTYKYEPSDVLRYEQRVGESFTPHPLFGGNQE